MTTVNTHKLLVAIVGLICVTVLMIVDSMSESIGAPIMSGVLFYMIGNGIAAKTGRPQIPIFAKKIDDESATAE